MAEKSYQELEKLYNDSVSADDKRYSEMKSNVLLVSGNHYSQKQKQNLSRVWASRRLSKDQKIRIMNNHINIAIGTWSNEILTHSPGVNVFPKNDAELQDVENAHLKRSAFEDIKYRHDYDGMVGKLSDDYSVLGEVWQYIWYDTTVGDVVGYEPYLDEDGFAVLDEQGNPIPDEDKPILTGDHVFETIPGYDIFFDAGVKEVKDAEFVGFRKLVDVYEMKKLVESDEELSQSEKDNLLDSLSADSENTYIVFDGVNGALTASKDTILVKHFFFKPCRKYPNGYYYFTFSGHIWKEGELQKDKLGKPIFPIINAYCDEFSGDRRGASKIRQGRPHQAEINRAVSKMAEIQLTAGDDKIIINETGKLTEGEKLSGVRQIKVRPGTLQQVIPGRVGEQYMGYVDFHIKSLYNNMGVNEAKVEKADPTGDITNTLYRSLKDKKRYVRYAKKFERFLVHQCDIALRLAEANWPDEMVVKSVGRSGYVNIKEFRGADDSSYEIKIVPMTENIESVMGKHLELTSILQYANGQLSSEDVGLLIEEMPFMANHQITKGITQNYRVLKNLILALDRGEQPYISKFDNNEYMISGLIARMREPDYQYLISKNPTIHENYMQQYEERTQMVEEQQKALRDAQAGMVPTGGYMVKCDVYTTDPNDPTQNKRLTLPSQAIEWLQETLAKQGAAMQQVSQLPIQAQTDVMPQAGPSVIQGGKQAG